MTQRLHNMPFGTQMMTDGRVKFTLWAPSAKSVDLRIDNHGSIVNLAMQVEDGWYTLMTDQAAPFSNYSFIINEGLAVPDPASRYQPHDVHGPSQVVDPVSWAWTDHDWQGRPWKEAVIYELHVGSFTTEGTFLGVCERLDYLVDLGITAIQLMPLADFPGRCNWGYDGVLLYAPDSSYGSPDELKRLIQSAHHKGLMVFLDVVYNHFGPDGNYLHKYNQCFFTPDRHTPWGASINVDGEDSHWVRQFFIHNALYWLEEYHLDGLRLDAVDAISDRSEIHLLYELAEAVQHQLGRDRHIHLIVENDSNSASLLQRSDDGSAYYYDAQWNDDIHNAMHVMLTGELNGCYIDFQHDPCQHVARCLAEGFSFQGEVSGYRDGKSRGESSSHLPTLAFISFMQNHDQIGNRPLGNRITDQLSDHRRIRLAMTILLLAPSPPMLFMGEEWGASTPFPFFCDFPAKLADRVIAGREAGYKKLAEYSQLDSAGVIPNPVDKQTFLNSVLNWQEHDESEHQCWLAFYRELIQLRHEQIIPYLDSFSGISSHYQCLSERVFELEWVLTQGVRLSLLANCGEQDFNYKEVVTGRLIYSNGLKSNAFDGVIPGWSALWFIEK